MSGIRLFLHVGDPLFLHGTGLGTRFAADNHPMNSFQINALQVFQQWLDEEEADRRFHLA